MLLPSCLCVAMQSSNLRQICRSWLLGVRSASCALAKVMLLWSKERRGSCASARLSVGAKPTLVTIGQTIGQILSTSSREYINKSAHLKVVHHLPHLCQIFGQKLHTRRACTLLPSTETPAWALRRHMKSQNTTLQTISGCPSAQPTGGALLLQSAQ